MTGEHMATPIDEKPVALNGTESAVSRALQTFLLPTIALLVLLSSLVAPFVGTKNKLEILAALSPDGEDKVVISGRVLYGGRGFGGATILAVANTRVGNEYSAEGRTRDGANKEGADPGAFELVLARRPTPGIKPAFYRTITSVTIRASNENNSLDGTEVLAVRTDQFQQIQFSLAAVAPVVGLFVFGIFWAFRRPGDPKQRRLQYYISVFSAVALTMAMIVIIAISLKNINNRGGELGGAKRNVVLSLGFAHVFKGSYVRALDPEWLFSFTTYRLKHSRPDDDDQDPSLGRTMVTVPVAPSPDGGVPPAAPPVKVGATAPAGPQGAASPAKPAAESAKAPTSLPAKPPEPAEKPATSEELVVQGLGAPLWVLLLSVLGAAVLTISMVVSWVRDPLDFGDEKSLRQRLESIVRHQFYVIFAPIGSVFVYQTLIVSQAASQPLMVGLAAFGSGMALNRLLDAALDTATKYWPKATPRSDGDQQRAADEKKK
jgi:hypothetical protein